MSERDRIRWDQRYHAVRSQLHPPGPPAPFSAWDHLFPTSGSGLDLACGEGAGSVWLASRGLEVWGLDVSPVAVEHATALAALSGLGGLCRFDTFDLDDGLPEGPPMDVILCHMFWDPRLSPAIVKRLKLGGLLAVATLSEVGVGPGPFRVAAGELVGAFAELEVVGQGEGGGKAWLLARARSRSGGKLS